MEACSDTQHLDVSFAELHFGGCNPVPVQLRTLANEPYMSAMGAKSLPEVCK